MSTEKITLEYPIKVDGIETSELNMRRCKVGDIKALDRIQGEVAQSIHLVAALCTIPPEAVEELDAADFMKLSQKVAGFLPYAGPTSGH